MIEFSPSKIATSLVDGWGSKTDGTDYDKQQKVGTQIGNILGNWSQLHPTAGSQTTAAQDGFGWGDRF
ncbi:MAG: hypothetical protein E7Z87_02975 [Cyanobacteria bacterium SIG26]|nr:hypothetical protein [Cyanobacteria bacterium SIG26]